DAAPGRAIGTHTLLGLEKPHALLVQEVFAAQRADGTKVDDIAGQLVIDRLARKDVDLGVMPAADDLQLRRAADLAREADAARAHDAAISEEANMLADVVLVRRRILVVDHPARRPAKTIAVILQQTLTRLVTDGAVERMIQ